MPAPAKRQAALAGNRHPAAAVGSLTPQSRRRSIDEFLRLIARMVDGCACRHPIVVGDGIMLEFRFAMMIMEPNTTRATTNTPKASARKLLVWSGALEI